jgi:FMN-dependent NADH-azoreductase
MFDITHINSNQLGSASYSKQVAEHVIRDLGEDTSLTVRDLEQVPLPHIDDDFVAASSLERLADENGMIEYLHRYRHDLPPVAWIENGPLPPLGNGR